MWHGVATEPASSRGAAPRPARSAGSNARSATRSAVGTHTLFVCAVERVEHGVDGPALVRVRGPVRVEPDQRPAVPSPVVSERDTSWGIEPVPERLRVLGGLDLGLLWGNLGVSLLVLVAGAVLVPALSLPYALVAIARRLPGREPDARASPALIGAQARVPAMVLMRAPLGERGSYLPTAINVVQCLGWTIFELLVIATAAAALSDELFGFEAQWPWTLVFGAAALALALLGPIGFVRTVRAPVRDLGRAARGRLPRPGGRSTGGGLADAWNRPGRGRPLDLAGHRHRRRRHRLVDPARGRLHALRALAARRVLGNGHRLPPAGRAAPRARRRHPPHAGRRATPAALPAAVAAGGLVALLALLALTVAETDEAFANAYSGAVSLQNLVPSVPQRLLIVATTTVGTIGALALDLTSYQRSCFLLGSFFVPLFAVLLADWLAAGARYDADDVFAAPAVAGRADRRLARGLRRVPVALADRARVVGRAGRSGSTRRRGGSARRCRASSSRSGSWRSSPAWIGRAPARCRPGASPKAPGPSSSGRRATAACGGAAAPCACPRRGRRARGRPGAPSRGAAGRSWSERCGAGPRGTCCRNRRSRRPRDPEPCVFEPVDDASGQEVVRREDRGRELPDSSRRAAARTPATSV